MHGGAQMSSKARPPRYWREKLADSKGLPQVKEITDKMSKRWGTGTVVIPAPGEVDEIMKRVPEGKLITVNGIRGLLAERHGATIGCPLTTGIFVWIAANAAEEAAAEGETDVTPYWRTLKPDGALNQKYPGGVERQAARLREEGHVVELGKGKKPPRVKDFEGRLL
jgi:hypothetical protein